MNLYVFLDGDPTNYIAYFRRAAVYLGMGKSKAALPDLSKVIELKTDFTAVSLLNFQCLD
jgi:DnaJ family protein C protein 3